MITPSLPNFCFVFVKRSFNACSCPIFVFVPNSCPLYVFVTTSYPVFVCVPTCFCICAQLISCICICAHLLNLKLLPDRAESFPRVGIDPRHQSCWPISNPCLGKIFQTPWKVFFFKFCAISTPGEFLFLIFKHYQKFFFISSPISNAWGIYRVSQKNVVIEQNFNQNSLL